MCSAQRKAAVLTKLLPPNNMPLRRLSQEKGISQATLAKWHAEARAKGQFLPDANVGPEGWTSRDKLAAVIGEPLCRHRFETNGERADECGRSWRILSAAWQLSRAAARLARGLLAGPRLGQ